MLTAHVLARFGTQTAIADAITKYRGRRFHKQAVNRWGRVVPPLPAMQLAYITQGSHHELHFDLHKYKNWKRGG